MMQVHASHWNLSSHDDPRLRLSPCEPCKPSEALADGWCLLQQYLINSTFVILGRTRLQFATMRTIEIIRTFKIFQSSRQFRTKELPRPPELTVSNAKLPRPPEPTVSNGTAPQATEAHNIERECSQGHRSRQFRTAQLQGRRSQS